MEKVTSRNRVAIVLTLAAYALLVAFTIPRHEPWADEAQSWLLARDSSLAHLWGTLLHYEGTPGLWQTLLHVLVRLGLSYSAYSFVSGFLGLTAAYLILRNAPLPLFIRILLPFTYFLCYQYAVIARSYALIAPLLFAIAALYPLAERRIGSMTLLLIALAGTSVHGFLISICIWITLYARTLYLRKRLSVATLAYGLALVFFLASAWPAKDVTFAEHRSLANLQLLPQVLKAGLAAAFAGHWVPSLALIALSAPLLWRGGGWLFFALASVILFLFGTIVYAQLWHFGILFLVWLFAIWISAYKTRLTAPALVALLAAIAVQCYWTASAVRYDWVQSYSGSRAAAQYLRQSGLLSGEIYAIGYSTVAVQPYFSANIYSDYHGGAYWDWSRRNTADDPGALVAASPRVKVLVGYKNLAEKQQWAGLLRLLGYSLTHHFDGATFWQTRVFELESFDLYSQSSSPRAAPSVTPMVTMADPAQAPQLLTGFYDIEGKSRWTARNFSVLLKVAPGAELSLKLYIPTPQLQNLGPITLSANVGGHELPSSTFSKSGESTYLAAIPPDALATGLAVVNFQLDKSSGGRNGDARDLGIIVTEVGFLPASPAQ
jgi:hypothetical protein